MRQPRSEMSLNATSGLGVELLTGLNGTEVVRGGGKDSHRFLC